VLEDVRNAYNYYQHMEQGAAQAKVIPDWLVERFAIAGTVDEVRRRVAIIPYGAGGASRADTIRSFAHAARL